MKHSLFILMLMLSFYVNAQVVTTKNLSMDAAKKIAAEARKFALTVNAPHGGPSIAVVDRAGNLLYLERPETTFGGSALVAYEKAKTAVLFEQPTKNFESKIKEGRTPLLSVGYNMLEGGTPVIYNGEIIGAVGISGAATSQQDVEISEAAVRAKID
jgi:glc operon protein GlcG